MNVFIFFSLISIAVCSKVHEYRHDILQEQVPLPEQSNKTELFKPHGVVGGALSKRNINLPKSRYQPRHGTVTQKTRYRRRTHISRARGSMHPPKRLPRIMNRPTTTRHRMSRQHGIRQRKYRGRNNAALKRYQASRKRSQLKRPKAIRHRMSKQQGITQQKYRGRNMAALKRYQASRTRLRSKTPTATRHRMSKQQGITKRKYRGRNIAALKRYQASRKRSQLKRPTTTRHRMSKQQGITQRQNTGRNMAALKRYQASRKRSQLKRPTTTRHRMSKQQGITQRQNTGRNMAALKRYQASRKRSQLKRPTTTRHRMSKQQGITQRQNTGRNMAALKRYQASRKRSQLKRPTATRQRMSKQQGITQRQNTGRNMAALKRYQASRNRLRSKTPTTTRHRMSKQQGIKQRKYRGRNMAALKRYQASRTRLRSKTPTATRHRMSKQQGITQRQNTGRNMAALKRYQASRNRLRSKRPTTPKHRMSKKRGIKQRKYRGRKIAALKRYQASRNRSRYKRPTLYRHRNSRPMDTIAEYKRNRKLRMQQLHNRRRKQGTKHKPRRYQRKRTKATKRRKVTPSRPMDTIAEYKRNRKLRMQRFRNQRRKQGTKQKTVRKNGWKVKTKHHPLSTKTTSKTSGPRKKIVIPIGKLSSSSGKGSGLAPVHSRCRRPPRILHGHVRLPSSYRRGSSAVYSCKKDYKLVGIATHVCQSDGKWSAELPACIKDVKPKKDKALKVQLKKISKDINDIEETDDGKALVIGVVITVILLLLITCHCIWIYVTRRGLEDKHKDVVKEGLVPVRDVPGIVEVSNSLCAKLCCCSDSNDLPETFRPRKSRSRASSVPGHDTLDDLIQTLSRTSARRSKHGSLSRAGSSTSARNDGPLHEIGITVSRDGAGSRHKSIHNVGSSASRASARSTGSLHQVRSKGSRISTRQGQLEDYLLAENGLTPDGGFPELPPYIPPMVDDLDDYDDDGPNPEMKKRGFGKKMGAETEMTNNSLNYYWNDNASIQRPKGRQVKSSIQREPGGKNSTPYFYKQKKARNSDERNRYRSTQHRNRMSQLSGGSQTASTNEGRLKTKIGKDRHGYRNINMNTNIQDIGKPERVSPNKAHQSSLSYIDYMINNCIDKSIGVDGCLGNQKSTYCDIPFRIEDYDLSHYSKIEMDTLSDNENDCINIFDIRTNNKTEIINNGTLGDETEQCNMSIQNNQIDNTDVQNEIAYGIFKTTINLQSNGDRSSENKRTSKKLDDCFIGNANTENRKKNSEVESTKKTFEPTVQLENINNSSQTFDASRDFDEDASVDQDSVEVVSADTDNDKNYDLSTQILDELFKDVQRQEGVVIGPDDVEVIEKETECVSDNDRSNHTLEVSNEYEQFEEAKSDPDSMAMAVVETESGNNEREEEAPDN